MDDIILSRLDAVAGYPGRDNLVDLTERAVGGAQIKNPRACLLTSLSTPAEEQRRWKFMEGKPDIAERCIDSARRVVERQLRDVFGITPNWVAVSGAREVDSDIAMSTEERERVHSKLNVLGEWRACGHFGTLEQCKAEAVRRQEASDG